MRKNIAMIIIFIYLLNTIRMIPLIIPDEIDLQNPIKTANKKHPP